MGKIEQAKQLLDMTQQLVVLSMAKDMVDDPTSVVKDGRIEALQAQVVSASEINSRAWLTVNIGFDGKGEPVGEFACGGSGRSLIMLKQYLGAKITNVLLEKGVCDCPRCTMAEVASLDEEMPDEVH